MPSTGRPLAPDHPGRPGRQFHSEIIRCGLQDRVIGGLVALEERSWRAVLLQNGEADITRGEWQATFAAPVLIWQPWDRETRLRARAGSVGAHVLLGERGHANAIGHKPEAASLRLMSRERVVLPLTDNPALSRDVAGAFDLIVREAGNRSPGSETIVEAQVRVLLVLLWRHAAAVHELATVAATSAQTLQRFRQMLEVHFRDRWSVGRYAGELGTSVDRLHDICTRTLGRPPLRLIHERTVHEAQILLERSTQTVDQIAGHLGFRSSGQFNKFFKLHVGTPPGAYRRDVQKTNTGRDAALHSYADWP